MGYYYHSQTNGTSHQSTYYADLLQTNNEREVCKPSQMKLERRPTKSHRLLSPLLCIQEAILGDEYGNGPHSGGTISFQRGRSGSAVRFD